MMDELIEETPEPLHVVVEQVRGLRKAAAIICLAFIAALAVGGGAMQRINADARARDRHTQCEGGNTFKRNDLARWQYVAGLVGTPHDPDDAKKVEDLKQYIIAADTLKHC